MSRYELQNLDTERHCDQMIREIEKRDPKYTKICRAGEPPTRDHSQPGYRGNRRRLNSTYLGGRIPARIDMRTSHKSR